MAPMWHMTALKVLPAVSIGFGFFLLLFSCLYMFGAVGLQTERVMNYMTSCSKRKYGNDPTCVWLMDEMAAGVIGLLFGLVQIGIGAAMFITKEKPQLLKVWAAANAILMLFILPAGVLPLHVYSPYPCNFGRSSGGRQSFGGRQDPGHDDGPRQNYPLKDECADVNSDRTNCFFHVGCNQLSVSGGNAVVLIYGIIGVLDAIFIFASAVILAMMYQAAADSPGGYNPPGSAGAVESKPSIQSSAASVPHARAAHSQASKPSHKSHR